MELKDFYYDLPKELIAQTPLPTRSDSRLLVLERDGGGLRHESFSDILSHINEGDCLVLNETRVLPARLFGVTAEGKQVEILLLRQISRFDWEILIKPGKRGKPGQEMSFGDGKLMGNITNVTDDGNRHIRFTFDGVFEELLDKFGEMPLPPYITQKLDDRERYQTVYSKNEGSAAAPTAGLHFTEELLRRVEAKGVCIAKVTLHVGLGTFRPVKTRNILEHKMHSEYCEIDEENAAIINQARGRGGRVIAVGTTSVRTLESIADKSGRVRAAKMDTSIFIYPGYEFKAVDAIITNFHLPESSLLMLVSAFAGRERVLAAYSEAVRERYRFFSFGDAMLLL